MVHSVGRGESFSPAPRHHAHHVHVPQSRQQGVGVVVPRRVRYTVRILVALPVQGVPQRHDDLTASAREEPHGGEPFRGYSVRFVGCVEELEQHRHGPRDGLGRPREHVLVFLAVIVVAEHHHLAVLEQRVPQCARIVASDCEPAPGSVPARLWGRVHLDSTRWDEPGFTEQRTDLLGLVREQREVPFVLRGRRRGRGRRGFSGEGFSTVIDELGGVSDARTRTGRDAGHPVGAANRRPGRDDADDPPRGRHLRRRARFTQCWFVFKEWVILLHNFGAALLRARNR